MMGLRSWGWSILVAVALCAWAAPARAETGGAKKGKGSGAQAEIEQATKRLVDAMVKNDAAYLEKELADDYVSIAATGKASTKKEVVERFRSGDLKYDAIDVKEQVIRVYGDAAVSTAMVELRGQSKQSGDLSGTYRATRVWVKRGGHWRSVSFQTTKVAAPAS